MSSELLAIFVALGSSGVSDALDTLGEPRRLVHGLQPIGPMRSTAGRAVTVQAEPVAHGDGRPPRHLCISAIEAGRAGDLLVLAVEDDPIPSAAWGGLLSLSAQAKGIRGSIVDGFCRDSAEIQSIGFPVYARGTTPTSAEGRSRDVELNVPVRVGNVIVEPGDYVVADGDGVIVVPSTTAQRVSTVGARMLDAEAAIAHRIETGESLRAVFDESYEALTASENLSTGRPSATAPHGSEEGLHDDDRS